MVKDNLHKAYWDILESELNDDPPEYGQAIRLLEEVREVSRAGFDVHSLTRCSELTSLLPSACLPLAPLLS